jgi:hypothetical protein
LIRPHGATWRSGYATVCKTVYSGSIPDVASISNPLISLKYFRGCGGLRARAACSIWRSEPPLDYRAARGWGSPVVAMELTGVCSAGCGGSRACAMLTRQPVCETEIVPSLHSKLADEASATGAGFCGAAACCGAGFCAMGFCDKAQPAHESKINKAELARIASLPGGA